jgi:hypothetical protein
LLDQLLLKHVVQLLATHTRMVFPHLGDQVQDALFPLLAGKLSVFVLIVGLPAKAKYPTDPPQAKVRAAYSQELDYLVADFFSMRRPSSCSATRMTFL